MTDKPELTREDIEEFRAWISDDAALTNTGKRICDLALRALSGGVAEGCACVPREPTPFMCTEGVRAMTGNGKPLWVTFADNNLTALDLVPVYKAMLAAAPASPKGEGEGWMPIETAPRDGTRILVRGGDIGPCVASAGWDNDRPDEIQWRVINDIVVSPTHWMPLPTHWMPRPSSLAGAKEGAK